MARLFPDPFQALFDLQRNLDAFRTSDWLTRGPSATGAYPPLNMFRQGDDFVVIAELPGVARDDVDVQVHGNRVRIAGKKTVDMPQDAGLHRRERVAGRFDRSVALPVEIDADGVKAEYRNGILALFLPRAEHEKPRQISIG